MSDVLHPELPYFLQSYEELKQHLDNELEKSTSSTDKGTTFAQFASEVIPQSEYGAQFGRLEMNPKSGDGGVDLHSSNDDGTKVLYGQSKVTIRTVDDIDLILSKFKDYYDKHHNISGPLQTALDLQAGVSAESKAKPGDVYFLVVTLIKLSGRLISEYEKSRRPSRTFYDRLKAEERIYFLDGPQLLPLMQAAYRKMHVLPSNITIHLQQPPLKHEGVFIGIISSQEIKRCYDEFGDSLFFENIREFLGFTKEKTKQRDSVNHAIFQTVENEPLRMLARNNGITFRASQVDVLDETTLLLHSGSIVNGCQTTMCIISAPQQECYVSAKVVETTEFWDITKAANFQNRVEQINLELAKYIRPQLAKRAARNLGLRVDDTTEASVFDVFKSIYKDRITYAEVYYLFVGLFSRTLGNVLKADYLRLRRDDFLEEFAAEDPDGENTFPILFELCKLAQVAQEAAELRYNRNPTYKNMFKRFWYENKPDYRSILVILAAFGCVEAQSMFVYEADASFASVQNLLERVKALIEVDKEKFIRYYQYAYEAIAHHLLSLNKDDVERLRTMYDDIRGANFDNIYASLRIIADGRESNEVSGYGSSEGTHSPK